MKGRKIDLNINQIDTLEDIGDCLSSKYRLTILSMLSKKSYSIQEILRVLDIPASTLSFHLKILKDAGLIKYVQNPSKKGNEKNISLNVEDIVIHFSPKEISNTKHIYDNISVGSFVNFDIQSPCLIATKNNILSPVDNPLVFTSSQRTDAELISFSKGTLEYNLLLDNIASSQITEISFSQEICSECPNYNNSWKSNITFWINNVEIGTFVSLGDYGGRRGNFSPEWWPIKSSNFGVLVNVCVNKDGTFINGKKASNTNIKDLKFDDSRYIRYKIGVKEDSTYVGGLNIFGKHFGDYKQNIVVSITYK